MAKRGVVQYVNPTATGGLPPVDPRRARHEERADDHEEAAILSEELAAAHRRAGERIEALRARRGGR